MASSRASASRPWLILAALEAVCFGPYFRSIGFYLDDWLHLELAGDGKTGLLASMRAFAARGGFSARPLDVPYFALFMSAGGAHPTFYRAVLVVLHLAVVALFYLLCREFSDDRELSLLSAALGLALPLGDASELWWSVSQQMLATALILASLWRHAKRSRAGRRGPAELVLSQLLYLLALLLYEGGIAFPLFLGGEFYARRRLARESRAAALALRDIAPYLATGLVYVLYSRVLAPMLIAPTRMPATLDPLHALKVYAAALRCATWGLAGLLVDSVSGGLRVFPPLLWALGVPAAAAVGWALPRATAERRPRAVLAAAGAAGFFAAYAVYAVSGAYTPRIHGVVGRVNLLGGLCLGAVAAAAFSGLPRRIARPVLALVLAACAVCHWAASSQWSAAYALQRRILADVDAQLPPGPATVLLFLTPPHVREAPVFWSHYDISSALRLSAGRSDLRADYAHSIDALPQGARAYNLDGGNTVYPYENLFIYHGPSRKLLPVRSSADLARLAGAQLH